MTNIIILIVVAAIIGAAVYYIIKEKKRGVKCIGCPYATQCANRGKCSGGEDGCGGNCGDKK